MSGITTFDSVFAGIDQNVSMESFLEGEQYVLKVHFWDVGPDMGENMEALSETHMLDIIANLNKDFNAFNIFFKFDGRTEIRSTAFRSIDHIQGSPQSGLPNQNDFGEFLRINNHYISGTINFYSLFYLNAGGYAYFDNSGLFGSIVAPYTRFRNEDDVVPPHEVGHYFNLSHTFFDCFGSCIENVTREPYLGNTGTPNPNYNADTAGDKIIDTNATPEGLTVNIDYEYPACVYIDRGIVDPVGQLYSDHEPEIKNFMSYGGGCQEEFSPGQVAVMRGQIDHLKNHPDGLLYITNYPVSILYEPYKGVYLGGLNCTDPPLFQYGFDYDFLDTSQAGTYNVPSEYEDTSFWVGGIVNSYDVDHGEPIQHFDHSALRIIQLGEIQPRKCWNTTASSLTSGCVINFLDGVPNGNYTITQQDSTGINSPTLIEDLQPGLYNIQGIYNDGSSQQTMILKEND